MGKNPNAKKLKERKHRDRTYSNDIEDLEEEAARLGITVLELQEQKEREAKKDESSDEESGSGEEQQKPAAKIKKGGKKSQSSSEDDDEEVKVAPQKQPQMPI